MESKLAIAENTIQEYRTNEVFSNAINSWNWIRKYKILGKKEIVKKLMN